MVLSYDALFRNQTDLSKNINDFNWKKKARRLPMYGRFLDRGMKQLTECMRHTKPICHVMLKTVSQPAIVTGTGSTETSEQLPYE